MKNRILAELEFGSILSGAEAQTATGAEILRRYQAYLIANESTYAIVNNFVKEASQHRYDRGVNEALNIISDYINMNKTSWALATAVESINSNNSSYNYINRNAAKQVENLLEMAEDDIVKYIKAGALKDVMFCESFRNIAMQVYKENPIIESTSEYTLVHPISMVENVGDGFLFEVAGNIYKIDSDKNIQESNWNEASNTFKIISSLLESNMCTVNNNDISIEFNNTIYTISEEGCCSKCKKDDSNKEKKEKKEKMSTDQLRENNRIVVMATNARAKAQVAEILEAIALLSENYDSIANMDNVSVYTTRNDKFMMIESGSNIYATLLKSNKNAKWTINENVIDALDFINRKTNVNLGDRYGDLIKEQMDNASIEEQIIFEQREEEKVKDSYVLRIEALTEKFKNDPVKLAVLSKLAKDLANID